MASITRQFKVPVPIQSTDIQAQCEKSFTRYIDSYFPPDMTSLFGKGADLTSYDTTPFAWNRPESIYPQGYTILSRISPEKVKPGVFPDNYFVSAVAILAENPILLTRLFSKSEVNLAGVYGIWLHINGSWQEIVIDDSFPFVSIHNEVRFASSHSSSNDLWLPLLHKAYAKAYGSYLKITAGILSQALNDLTGAPCECVNFESGNLGGDALWKKMEISERKGHIIAFNVLKKHFHRILEGGTGLVVGMAYRLISAFEHDLGNGKRERYVQLRSLWGKVSLAQLWPEYQSKWTSKLSDKYGLVETENTFWIPMEYATKHFSEIVICKIQKEFIYQSLSFPVERYSMAQLHMADASNVNITLHQQDYRSLPISQKEVAKRGYLYARLTIVSIKSTGLCVVKSVFGVGRNITINENLAAGEYIVMVEQLLPHGEDTHLGGSSPTSLATKFTIEISAQYRNYYFNKYNEQMSPEIFLATELEAWKGFVILNYDKLSGASSKEQPYSFAFLKDDEAFIQIEAIRNNTGSIDKKAIFYDYERHYKGHGLEPSYNVKNGIAILHPNPQGVDLVLLKHDPHEHSSEYQISGFLPTISSSGLDENPQKLLRFWLELSNSHLESHRKGQDQRRERTAGEVQSAEKDDKGCSLI